MQLEHMVWWHMFMVMQHCLELEYLNDKKARKLVWSSNSSQSTTMKSDENIERVWNLMGVDHHVVIRSMTDLLTVNKESICEILTIDMDMWMVCVMTVAKHWHTAKKWKELEVYTDLAEQTGILPSCLNRVVSSYDSWYSTMTVEFKDKASSRYSQQAYFSDWNSKARMPCLKVKAMLNVLLDIKGTVHHEYLPVGYMVNQYL
jgi:hypothetical protein